MPLERAKEHEPSYQDVFAYRDVRTQEVRLFPAYEMLTSTQSVGALWDSGKQVVPPKGEHKLPVEVHEAAADSDVDA